MKLKVISLIVLLFAGNAAASSIKLACDYVSTACGESGCVQKDKISQIEFDEEAGTLKWKGDKKWKTAKKVKFGDTEISGKLSGNFNSLGVPHELKLDRVTGRMEYLIWGEVGWSGPCEVVDETKRAF